MNELTVFHHNKTLVTDSRDVAVMVGKQHKHLLRDIRNYLEHMRNNTEPNFAPSDFFIPSTYRDSTGRELPCYLITRKGCEMIANKMTGEKGVLFTATYINGFHAMENHIEAQATELERMETEAKALRARAMEMNAKTRLIQTLMKTTEAKNLSQIALEVYGLKAFESATGHDMGQHLPQCEKTYSATEIGNRLGITANKVGTLANRHNLKTDEYGITVMDKSRYSAKEVSTFRYYEKVVPVLGAILEQ